MDTQGLDPRLIDPRPWADSILKVFHGGGWVVPALIALWIVFKWWPGRSAKGTHHAD